MPKPVSADLDLSFLVPCGQEVQVFPENQNGKDMICYASECSVCSVQIMAMKVLSFLIVIMTAVAALIFAYAGALYALSPSNINNIKKAHSIFLSTLMGMVIVLAAWLIVDTIMRALYAADSKWGPWNDMLCQNYEARYCVPKLKGLEANPVQAPPSTQPLDCKAAGGSCKSVGVCTGQSMADGTTCTKNSVDTTCCLPDGFGKSCGKDSAGNQRACYPPVGMSYQWDCSGSTPPDTCRAGYACCTFNPNATPSPPPPGNGSYDTTKISSQEARNLLQAAHVNMQNFSDGPPIERGVINNIIAMNQACGGCVTVTSLSGGHESGGHVAGTKMDLSTRENQGGPQLEQYITTTWEKMPDRTGAAGGPQYYSPMNGGIVCVKESSPSHWDCCNNHNKSVCN